jgi:hypothetical protein
MSGLGLWALPIMYVLAMCSASAIIYPIDQALMKGAFVKWVKYSGNQVTKSILPIYRYDPHDRQACSSAYADTALSGRADT